MRKPLWMQLIRLSANKEVEDAQKVGDRTLAIFLGKGFYHFTTYNMVGRKPSVFENIPYENHLEGQWSYIYYSYDLDAQTATGWVRFAGAAEDGEDIISRA
jgi:hypothetical protein